MVEFGMTKEDEKYGEALFELAGEELEYIDVDTDYEIFVEQFEVKTASPYGEVAPEVHDITIEVQTDPNQFATFTFSVTADRLDEFLSEPTGQPRRFKLVRDDDVSGTSGTGVVATGVAYPDGAVHMQWRNADNEDLDSDSNGCSFKPAPDGIEATKEIHGHEGRTEMVWIDTEEETDGW